MLRACFLLSLLLSTNSVANTFMPTGADGGTYHAIGKDIAHIVIPYGLDITVKNSVGSVDNIRQLLKDDEADLSLAQSDVITALKSSPQATTQSAIQNLRLVLPLYQEEVHVLANKSVQTLADLEGKKVGVGQIGSGTHVTATNILNLLHIQVLPNNELAPLEAYKALLFGQLDAVFFVGGKPINYIQGLLEMNTRDDLKAYADQMHLLPIEDSRLDGVYTKTSIEPSDYASKSGEYTLTEKTVPTVSVVAALVTKDFPDDKKWITGKRCRQINKVYRALNKRLPRLASGGSDNNTYHPKWASVDFKLPIDLERSDCIKTVAPTKKETVATSVTKPVKPPVPNNIEVAPLTKAELAEASCLLKTGKPCAATAELPKETEQPADTSPLTNEMINSLLPTL